MQLHTLTIHQICEGLKEKDFSSEELTRAYLERISQTEKDIGAFITVLEEEALIQARTVDEKRKRGEELSPLAGIPMGISDNICTKGVRTTCASDMLYNFVPPYHATVTEKLISAGSVLVGKCNMDEFGIGSSTENSCVHPTRNPFDPEAVPGGSCGGAAAAVAAGTAAFAIGSDSGGSIRQPASFCGVTGLKPTYGYVSRYGLISSATSLDQIGPFARDIKDLALILNVICGYDVKDSASASVDAADFTKNLINDVKGLRIGLPAEFFGAGTAPEVAAKLREAVDILQELGAVCEEVAMPHTEYALAAHYIISSAEASSNLARYDGVRYGLRVDADDVLNMFKKTRSRGFGTEVQKRIMLGTHVLSTGQYDAYYKQALKIRTLIRQDFQRAFEQFDCLLTPASPTTAFKQGEKAGNSLAMHQADTCTIPANLAGVPAMSLPFGMVEGLPAGLQLIGRHFDEGTLLRVGYTLEQNTDQTRPMPNLPVGGQNE